MYLSKIIVRERDRYRMGNGSSTSTMKTSSSSSSSSRIVCVIGQGFLGTKIVAELVMSGCIVTTVDTYVTNARAEEKESWTPCATFSPAAFKRTKRNGVVC